MRRKDKEIEDRALIDQVIDHAQVCRLGLCKDNQPYVVPISFGYDGSQIYFHTADEGLKLQYLAANPHVCFEMEYDVKTITDETSACKWSQSFYSIIGFGQVHEITALPQKIEALNHLMKHYSGRDWEFGERSFNKIKIWAITIDQVTGKKSKDKVRNTVYVFDYDGITVAHLGDLQQIPTQSEIELLGTVNVALVPVGGGNSLNAAKAAEVVSMLEPNLVIPMHYSTPDSKIKLDEINKFIKEMGLSKQEPQPLLKVSRSSLPSETHVVVLEYQKG